MRGTFINKHLTLIFLILLMRLQLSAQTKSDIFNEETPLTWMGVDFSQVLYSGTTGSATTGEMKEEFLQINTLLLEETGKYNLGKAFHKNVVKPEIEIIQSLNSTIDTNKIISSKAYQYNRINKDKVNALVNNYNTGTIRGTAAVIIVEDLNKTWETGSMWVVYFNAQTKEVILASKLLGEASGLGFRNHWASTIDDVLKKVQSKEYKKWQKEFAGKKK